MKKNFVFSFFLVVVMSLGIAHQSYAQNVSVNLNLQNVQLEKVLNEIEKQTNYLFVYNKNVNVGRIVSVSAQQKNLREVLSQLLRDTDITFAVEESTIILSQKSSQAKSRTIEGTVTDQNGAPLPGVSVLVKGTLNGTTTGAKGNFTLNVDENAQTLQLSFLGMEAKEVAIGGSRVLNIIMSESSIKVGEVVVTALGITKESKSLAYNVQTINSDEVVRVKDANFINSLSGKVAGVTINSSSAGAGGSSRVVMRGTKSLVGNNNALYVIDGIPMPSLSSSQPDGDFYSGAGQSGDGISNLNPEDIESMSILSGPAAAALYGGDAANGVVIITTKKGVKNDFSIQYTNNTTFFSPFVMPRFQNTYGLSEVESYYSWGDKLDKPSSYKPRDFFQTGFNVTNSVSLSTGNEKSQTYISVGSVNAAGIIHNNDYDRYNVSFRNTSTYFDGKLTFDVGFMYANINEQNMVSQGQYSNPLIPVYLFPPGDDIRKYETFERYNPERFFKTQFWPFGDQGYGMQNPYWITERNLFGNEKDRYLVNGTAKYQIADWINVTGRAKFDNNVEVSERKYYASTWTVLASDNGFYSRDNTNTKRLYADAIVNINKTIDDYSIAANVGASYMNTKNVSTSHGGKLGGIGAGVANLFAFSNISQNPGDVKYLQEGYDDNIQSVFATAQLGYKNMVYIDLSGRNEWASMLANTSHMSYFYPSVGLSVVATDLFGIRSNTLSFLKLRGSYSEVGNHPLRYVSNPTHEMVMGLPSMFTDLPFPIKPERTKSWEGGFNATFWGNKVKIDATFYQSSTYNQTIHGTLPTSSGYSGFYVNTGKVSNKGIELTLGLKQDIGRVEWNSSLVYSLNRNKIDQLIEPGLRNPVNGDLIEMDRIDLGGNSAYHMFLTEGGTMGDLYVNKLRTDEHGMIWVNPVTFSVEADPEGAQTYAGRVTPDFTLGFRNGFSYKGVDLDFLISARVGGIGLSVTQSIMDGFGVSEASAQARDNGGVVVNGYLLPASNYYSVVGSGQGVGSMYIYDATNVRLAELSLGYTIPLGKKALKYIKGINVSLVGRNLLMIYNRAPFDPESTASTGTYFQGIDYFMQPSLRSVGFAVKLNF